MRDFIQLLEQINELKIINKPTDCELEIAHIAYIEAKKPEPKALLFNAPVSNGEVLKTPVLMNLFANENILNLVLNSSADGIAARISELLNLHIPSSLGGKISLANKLLGLKNIAPKRKICPNAPCKKREYKLSELPVLKTWPNDAGRFITMGQVYTQSLDGKSNNLGMYRLQLAKDSNNDDALIMHFQLHKDANNFYHEYKKAGKNMPIAVAIGGHPINILCAQAPLPRGIFEPILAGFINQSSMQLIKCETNDLYVPQDSDFIIEAEININEPLAVEGPFGDHTGFYTPQGLFPLAKITKITGKKDAIFSATVVGKPPLEDRWMGYATERIFAPLLKQSIPQLIDYRLPENGCFHNLCLVKIRAEYPNAAKMIAHAFWGLGQMAFCKNIIVVDEAAPSLKDDVALAEYILEQLCADKIFTSSGICDELDHSSEQIGYGGKLLIDATSASKYSSNTFRDANTLQNRSTTSAYSSSAAAQNRFEKANLSGLLAAFNTNKYDIFFQTSLCPIICLHLEQKPGDLAHCYELAKEHLGGVVVLFDDAQSNSAYMLLFRALSNFDAARDIKISPKGVLIDACKKGEMDGYFTPWPQETMCDFGVVKNLIEKQIIQADFALFKQFEILSDLQINILKETQDGNL